MADLIPVQWRDDKLAILDQTLLPAEEAYLETGDYADVASAIKRLAVRGAPAIGVATAYGVALGALAIRAETKAEFLQQLETVILTFRQSRPTARNLFWALEKMKAVAEAGETVNVIKRDLVAEARKIHDEQIESDKALSRLGASLFKENDIILTHCNTGALATAGCGTALGVIKEAFAQFKNIRVIATETRPLLQGARLTAFEFKKGRNTLYPDHGLHGRFLYAAEKGQCHNHRRRPHCS